MIEIALSSSEKRSIRYLAVDFNGTLACDGILPDPVRSKLQQLSKRLEIHVLTSDTFGTVESQIDNRIGKLQIIPAEHQAAYKGRYIQEFGTRQTAAIGNGANDYLMLKTAAIGIGVIGQEGAATLALNNTDLICSRITDALDLFNHPKRIKATLRS